MTKLGWALAIGILIVLVGGGAAVYLTQQRAMPAPQEEATDITDETSPEALVPEQPTATVGASVGAQSPVTVTYTDQGFNPKTINVATGASVHFVNNSTHGMWVASDDHPSHTEYDGTSTKDHCANGTATNGTFDECIAAAPGTVFNYTFTKAGTFEYHNHTKSGDTGTVVVK